jgi:hypothetical protein
MSKKAARVGMVALGAAAVVGVASGSALAATPSSSPPSLAVIQAKAAAAITHRVDDLQAAISKANSIKQLGSSAPTLVSYLQADIAPLQALGTKIAGDTSATTAESDGLTIFTDYRVLALVLPSARLAGTADGIDVTVIPNLTTLSAKAASHVNPGNQATVQPLIDDLNTQIQSATSGTSGVAGTLLSYTPAQWNADHDLLTSPRGTVQAAVKEIAAARSDVAKLRTLLEDAAAPTTTPTTGS